MSFDDNIPPDFDIDDVKARFRVEMRRQGMSWEQLCNSTGLAPERITRAFEMGSDGFPPKMQIFQQISVALGHDPDWLVFGCESAIEEPQPSKLADVSRAIWKFIYKGEIPHSIGKQFEAFVLNALSAARPPSVRTAYRKEFPVTMRAVARWYGRFLDAN
jgi:transcriptional regulator with XRE-family HTH domain